MTFTLSARHARAALAHLDALACCRRWRDREAEARRVDPRDYEAASRRADAALRCYKRVALDAWERTWDLEQPDDGADLPETHDDAIEWHRKSETAAEVWGYAPVVDLDERRRR